MVIALFDVFQSVVVPRWTGRTFRLTPLLVDALWPVWRGAGLRIRSAKRREGFLASFGPLALLLFLLQWVLVLILGYGIALHALRHQIRPVPTSIGSAFYLAGTSLFTLGFGDMVAIGGLSRATMLAAAASGLAVLALVLALVFTLYGAFQRREVLVVMLDARAGTPPSGVALLETYGHGGAIDDLPQVFAAWEQWTAEVLATHLAYPILAYFRSSREHESWISALGAILDACTVLLTTIDGTPEIQARMMSKLGSRTIEDFGAWFELPEEPGPGVQCQEYDLARERLATAGYAFRDAQESWAAFAARRSDYAGALNGLAKYFAIPPAQWIGDRSILPLDPHHL